MSHWNVLFLAVVVLANGILTFPSLAAPTVKNLGGATSGISTGTKTQTTNNRNPSVRALGLSNASVTTTNNGANTVATKATTSGDSTRLSGLHNNIIKSIGSKLSANHAAQPSDTNKYDLNQRVTNLEEAMVTKQEILEPGDGIDIKGNTIGLSAGMLSLPERLDEIEQIVSQLNNMNVVEYFDPGFLNQNKP